jgi:subtilisin family serine protease
LGYIKAEYDKALKGFTVCGVKSERQLNAIRNNSFVASVEQDQVVTADALRTVMNPLSWGLDRIDQRASTLDTRYTYDDTVTPVNVYVLDTGILTSHAQFEGRAFAGYNFVNNNTDSKDCHGHGTHCTGTIGGKDYGVCKHCRLIAVTVLGCKGSGTLSDLISGINWVISHANSTGVPSVISMSLGSKYSDTVNSAVANAVNAGIVTVVAAGNSNANACNYSPASTPSAITVGAVSKSMAMSWYSNFGSCVDIFAPGDDIPSAWITSDTAVMTLSGTSMAAPHVAGVAAIYRSYNPSKNAAQVREYIVQSDTSNVVTGLDAASPNVLLYSVISANFPIVGKVDVFTMSPTGVYLAGYACNYGLPQSIEVQALKSATGSALRSTIANLVSEPDVSGYCGTSGVSHRFSFPFTFDEIASLNGTICLFVECLECQDGPII